MIQEYFYSPSSIQTNVIIFKDNETQEIAGFSVYYFFKHYFKTNDKSKENLYIMTTLFGCLNEKKRRTGLRKEYFKIKGFSDLIDYPNCNLVHFDVSINLISYYGVCQVSDLVFPSWARQVTKRVEEFVDGLIDRLEYERSGNEKFVVVDEFEDVAYDREY